MHEHLFKHLFACQTRGYMLNALQMSNLTYTIWDMYYHPSLPVSKMELIWSKYSLAYDRHIEIPIWVEEKCLFSCDISPSFVNLKCLQAFSATWGYDVIITCHFPFYIFLHMKDFPLLVFLPTLCFVGSCYVLVIHPSAPLVILMFESHKMFWSLVKISVL